MYLHEEFGGKYPLKWVKKTYEGAWSKYRADLDTLLREIVQDLNTANAGGTSDPAAAAAGRARAGPRPDRPPMAKFQTSAGAKYRMTSLRLCICPGRCHLRAADRSGAELLY